MFSVQNHKVDDGKASLCKELSSMVRDAHTALADLRSHNAEQAFSQALALLETSTPKVIVLLICTSVPKLQHFTLQHFTLLYNICTNILWVFIYYSHLSSLHYPDNNVVQHIAHKCSTTGLFPARDIFVASHVFSPHVSCQSLLSTVK